MNETGAVSIASAAADCATLRTLSLCNNSIKNVGATAFGHLVEKAPHIETLALYNNELPRSSITYVLQQCREHNVRVAIDGAEAIEN